MAWIKRNLFFVIGSVIAVLLIGVGVYYLIAEMAAESKVSADIEQQYAELTRLNQLNPHPGNDQIDNIKNAKLQEAALKAYLAKLTPLFQKIPGIPDTSGTTNKVSNSEFAAQLRNTVSDLKHVAMVQSVILPTDYYFSFESQRKIMIFDPTSLDKLALQLGEVKVLSEILFAAKINSLDSIRRESVSTNDNNPSDYLSEKTTSTALADLAPYELTFRCFSSELAFVLSHLASSPNGFIVKSINVEPSSGFTGTDDPNNPNNANPAGAPAAPMFEGPIRRPVPPGSPEAGYAPRPYSPQPQATAGATAKGPQVFITEKPFRVTLMVEVVKLKPAAK
jgi:hypothetical protein